MTRPLDPDLREDVKALVRQAIVLSAEYGTDLERDIQLAAEEPLTDDEARPLFTRIVTLMRGGFEEGLDDARKAAIAAEVAEIVQEVLAHRGLRRATAASDGQKGGGDAAVAMPTATLTNDHHLALFAWNGLPVRDVSPAPVFNGRSIPMLEGYVRTEDLRLWPENHRLELHLAEFRQQHRRSPTDEELVQLLHGLLPFPGTTSKRDPFGMQELAESIAVKGVQTPPIIDWAGELKDGNRRVAACLLIRNSAEYSAEAKEMASKIRVWQTPKGTTPDQIDAIVVSLNFEKDLKIPWPEYVKARQVADYYYELYDSERAVPTPDRERALKRQVAERFAIKTTQVTRFLKMVRWADEFEEHHRENRNRDEASIRYRSNDLFQYFYELDAGRGEDKLGAKIRQDDAFKALVFDLMYDGKFRNWTELRHMRKVVNSPKAIESVMKAHVEPDVVRAREHISDALDEARKNDLATKRIGMREWLEELVTRLDEAPPSLWRELETEVLRAVRRSLMAAEGAVAAELTARGVPPPREDRTP